MTMDELREETARQMDLTPSYNKDKNKNALTLRIIIYLSILFFLYNTYVTKIENENISLKKLYSYAISYYNNYDEMAHEAYLLNYKAYEQIERKEYKKAIANLQKVLEKYTKINDEKVKEQVLYANLNLIWTLQRTKQHSSAIQASNSFIDLYADDSSDITQVKVAQAMGLKAWSQKELNERRHANKTYHQLIAKFTKNKNTKIQAEVSRALYNRGHNYMILGYFEPALQDFNAHLRLYKTNTMRVIREDSAATMVDKAHILDKLGRKAEAKLLRKELFAKFKSSESKLINQALQRALQDSNKLTNL